jgi:hypothetical protein
MLALTRTQHASSKLFQLADIVTDERSLEVSDGYRITGQPADTRTRAGRFSRVYQLHHYNRFFSFSRSSSVL